MTIYKVHNDLDDNTLFGFTSSSVWSRKAGLRRELLDPRYTSKLHEQIKSLAKNHFQILFVEAVANCTVDEVSTDNRIKNERKETSAATILDGYRGIVSRSRLNVKI